MKTNACIKKVWLIINSVPYNVMTDNFGSIIMTCWRVFAVK